MIYKFEVVNPDPVEELEGWQWNNAEILDHICFSETIPDEDLIKLAVSHGFLAEELKGEVDVVDDWPVIELQKSTIPFDNESGKPILAFVMCGPEE